jgi:Protein of unknown function (DUF1501)
MNVKMTRQLTRREMIEALGGGLGIVGLASAFAGLSESSVHAATGGRYSGPLLPARAKHMIMLFMTGGPSQLDLFDYKPDLFKYVGQRPAAVDLRTERPTAGLMPTPFEFRRFGRGGVEVSELLPNLASVIDDICVIKSMFTFNPTHTPARNLLATGSVLSTRPSIGSWVTYGLGAENENLPAFIALNAVPNGTGLQHIRAGFLPTEYQGVTFAVSDPDPEAIIPNLRNTSLGPADQRVDLDALQALNRRFDARFAGDAFLEGRIKSMEAAYRMQSEAMDVFDIRKEPEAVRQEYGTSPFGNGCLLAARLVEAGVRFVHVDYPGGQIWDTHRDVVDSLRKHCPDMDRASGALIRDLKRRGLLDDTLVVWGGEFGRTPVSESGNGRDHNPYGFTMFVAGGGFKGGLAYGETDEFGFKAVENRVSIHDLHATLLHQLGMDHTKLTYRYAGRDFRLTDVSGEVVRDILT